MAKGSLPEIRAVSTGHLPRVNPARDESAKSLHPSQIHLQRRRSIGHELSQKGKVAKRDPLRTMKGALGWQTVSRTNYGMDRTIRLSRWRQYPGDRSATGNVMAT